MAPRVTARERTISRTRADRSRPMRPSSMMRPVSTEGNSERTDEATMQRKMSESCGR